MLFFKKKYINLILFILLLLLSIFVLIFSEQISNSNIESLENKDQDKKEDENNVNCKNPTKILQSTSNSSQVKTHNIVQNSLHKSKLQSCLFPNSHEELIKELTIKEKKNNALNK